MLDAYIRAFSHLQPPRAPFHWTAARKSAPFKALLLLAISDLVAKGIIHRNFVVPDGAVADRFGRYWTVVTGMQARQANLELAFLGLVGDGFWHLETKPRLLGNAQSIPNRAARPQRLQDIAGVSFDEELFNYLCEVPSRYLLQQTLIESYIPLAQQERLSLVRRTVVAQASELMGKAAGNGPHMPASGETSTGPLGDSGEDVTRHSAVEHDGRCESPWDNQHAAPREPRDLLDLCGRNLQLLAEWDELSTGEQKSINVRSASIVALRLRNLLADANAFYERGLQPFDVRKMVGRARRTAPSDSAGRISIVDLQGLSRTSMQVVVALICTEILRAAQDSSDPIRPVFLVIEEGHTFAPAREASIALPIIKKVFAEGRKFGVGAAIVSQRPSKLDSGVTSQANTIIAMRIKNPEDQAFIRSTSDYFSEVDVKELPSLSTGEALVSGRAILAPLLVKVGQKVLVHGGESPDVVRSWKA